MNQIQLDNKLSLDSKSALGGVGDSAKVVDTGAGAHAYGYNGSGQLVTDDWTYGGRTYRKTFTYTSGNLTGETDWVVTV